MVITCCGPCSQEMQALAAVQHHPHIVGLFDAWFEPDMRGDAEQAYLKLELCGESLGAVFKRRVQMKEQDVLDMLRQVKLAIMGACLAHQACGSTK